MHGLSPCGKCVHPEAHMSQERILIIGYGFSGRRFERVLTYFCSLRPDLATLEGICDLSQERLDTSPSDVGKFVDLGEALTVTDPTVVVVAVNESAHYEVLKELKTNRRRLILCEKPLTSTLVEAEDLQTDFENLSVSVNFVERYSPVVNRYLEWRKQHPGMSPTRIEFFWGKYRVADQRPSMGVLSELSHPLDLIYYLFDIDTYSIHAAHGVASDFSPYHRQLLDSVDILLRAENCLIVGHSSFVWSRRRRNIMAFLSDGDSHLFLVNFDFDLPLWDCDSLQIISIDYEGDRKEVVLDFRVDNDDFPVELHRGFKVYEYARNSIKAFVREESRREIVNYSQALRIQRVLDEIEGFLAQNNSIQPNSIHCQPF